MPEPIAAWWARRQWSRGTDVPYRVGEFREAWASWPVLVRQYHPDRNGGIVLSQVPPAADVFLTWDCDAGHVFVATPSEQRSRPGRERRRSSWCPDCAALARPRAPRLPAAPDALALPGLSAPTVGTEPTVGTVPARTIPAAALPGGSMPVAQPARPRRTRPARRLCTTTPDLPVGEPFTSACAPKPASAVEARLRADLTARLAYTAGFTAVRLGQPFFDHLEAWPDVILPELRVAIEYDSTGRHGLEHVGKREDADRRKDRALRAAGWEVVRVRTGRLPALGPHDLMVSGLTKGTVGMLLDRLRDIRGPFLVDAYLR